MEENPQSTFLEGEITGVNFSLATEKEMCTASISECPISHSSQLTNPFLGLPLESGKCESCGTSEAGKCEGHFGYIEFPIPIYHPCHVGELKRMLSLLCLKCLKLKKTKLKTSGVAERIFSCCEEASQVSIRDVKTTDGAYYLELKLPSRSRLREGVWNFLEKYGFCCVDSHTRTLLPCEVMQILKRIPQDTRKKLFAKGYFPQDGYILKCLPVPPNCLSMPDVSDGINIMSSDLSITMLKKVLKKVDIIKSSRSGAPNFESHEVEANDLQIAIDQYLQIRGTGKPARDVETRLGISKESGDSTTKLWLEKMRTLFIRKGCGFSSRSVITGDAYKRVNEIGIPFEIAQRITFEERVNSHNIAYLQELVDNKLCLTYKDGSSTFSLREGSKGHTFLRAGQVVHRRIMDGDIVFINRPPTTHKHSLQALSVYVHEDHTVKINPLICGPLSADFDGDCIHLFYPQSLAAKAEVVELFSVERQLLSSHSGSLNLQLTTDALLSLKTMFKAYFLDRAAAQQLAMFVPTSLPQPALLKANRFGLYWTALQILQTALPASFNCSGDRYLINQSDILKIDFQRDILQSLINEIVISVFFEKGPDAVLKFFNSLQPLLMENMFSEGFSVGLEDFYISRDAIRSIKKNFKVISPLLCNLRSTYNELMELQLENHIRHVKHSIANSILRSSALGDLIDSKSDSAVTKVVQQVGFLGLQISDRRKFYTKILVDDMASHFERIYPHGMVNYPSAQHGLIQSCFFHGLDSFEEMVHSISTREVIVRSSRGLSEPGTLFKNLMAILRDVVICYDGTVRNVCSNSIIQFEYGLTVGNKSQDLFPAGEPVGVLAATAMSNPAYKAVLDSTPNSNSSWDLMKEILLSKVSFKNDIADRRVILYLNECGCGKKYCQEKAAYIVKNHLEKVSLKDIAKCFMIEYRSQRSLPGCLEPEEGLVGHVHLKKMKLQDLNVSMQVVLQKCQETIDSFKKKKKVGNLFRRTELSVSESCSFPQYCVDESFEMPCLTFFWKDNSETHLERASNLFADIIYPVLLETIIKGDHRISSANIIWASPDSTTWIRNPSMTAKGELALDVVLEKSAVKKSGDAWRIAIDSCLPVLHLLDTTRCIPYAIKQVQELLGVSCAFDQAVQRLSTSVSMVAKGVLKEHLILLANSMTCAGNLVGFNSGGYKALSRSFDIQVPFTEATLFTPRKCFERAAEKCHVDSLSSVVASCAWGKHVAVGTGSRFDVLWDTKQASLDQEGSTDVYNFLNMVRSSESIEETGTACLGMEIDDLIPDDEIEDWNLSPERNSASDKLTFEDSAEFQNCLDNQQEESSWASWGNKKDEKHEVSAWKAKEDSVKDSDWNPGTGTLKSSAYCGWGSGEAEESNTAWGKGQAYAKPQGEPAKPAVWNSGDALRGEDEDVGAPLGTGKRDSKAQEESLKTDGWNTGATWGKKVEDVGVSWGSSNLEKKTLGRSADSGGWGGKSKDVGAAWGTRKGEHKAQEESANSGGLGGGGSWDGKSKEVGDAWPAWGSGKGDCKAQVESVSSDGWGSGLSWGGKSKDAGEGYWGGKSKDAGEGSWGGKSNDVGDAEAAGDSWGGRSKDVGDAGAAWGSIEGDDKARGESGWSAGNAWAGKSKDSGAAWGAGKGGTNVQGDSGKSGGWSGPKKGGKDGKKSSNETNASKTWSSWGSGPVTPKPKPKDVMLTFTRQRVDMFTSEEQIILSEVESLMQSIRRIMHNSGYNDDDPLSADDQSFVFDNVLNYHPDKAVKIGSGIDHLTVSKHINFPESRCFYVVSTDGQRRDFSYRKSLENWVMMKHPELAKDFNEKYFQKRTGGSRQRNPAPEETGNGSQLQNLVPEGNVDENRS